MRTMKRGRQHVLATLAIGAMIAMAAPASAAQPLSPHEAADGLLLTSPFQGLASTSPESASEPLANALAVLTSQGISPERATQALDVQGKLAGAGLTNTVEDVLGSSYAGVWFEPTTAKLHVGVTSAASQRAVARAVAHAGLSAYVVETPVRSTWAMLMKTKRAWHNTLATLLASAQAMTGIDAAHNAVGITLASSVPPAERAALESQAASSNVNIRFTAAPSPQLNIRKKATCTEPFVAKEVYCEKTMVSGVRIVTPKTGCTGGPLLIKGTETYLLTAGHCFAEEAPGSTTFNNLTVTSAYPEKEPKQKEIGKEGKWYNNNERDMGEVKVTSANFSQAQPTPVPALMAQWGKGPKTPHAVEGDVAATEGFTMCHEGQASGEHCGEIKMLDVEGAGTKHVVEIGACSNSGDSGGPYFLRSKGESIFMAGTEVGGPFPDCTLEGPYKSFFEPLISLAGAEQFGILASFPEQVVLSTANETRKELPKILPEATALKPIAFTGKSGKSTFESVGGKKVECEKDTASGSISSSKLGTFKIKFEGCKSTGVNCTGLGDAASNITTEGEMHLWYGFLKKEEVLHTTVAFLLNHLHFTCVLVLVLVLGCVAGLIKPVNTLTKKMEVIIEQTKGVNDITKVLNEKNEKIACELKLSANEGAEEGLGQTTTEEVEGFEQEAKKIEVELMA